MDSLFSGSPWLLPSLALLFAFFGSILISDEKTKEILKQDLWGAFTLVVGIVLVIVGYSTSVLILQGGLLALGGFVSGVGLLVSLPQGVTELISSRKNLKLVTWLLGMFMVIFFQIPYVEVMMEAFGKIIAEGKMSDLLGMLGGVVLIILSIFTKKKEKKS